MTIVGNGNQYNATTINNRNVNNTNDVNNVNNTNNSNNVNNTNNTNNTNQSQNIPNSVDVRNDISNSNLNNGNVDLSRLDDIGTLGNGSGDGVMGTRIHNRYMSADEGNHDPDRVVDFSSRSTRDTFLSQWSQTASGNGGAESACGPTVLTAASIHAWGRNGLSTLIYAAQSYDRNTHGAGSRIDSGMSDILDTITNNREVTQGDVDQIRDYVMDVLNRRERAGGERTDGIGAGTIQDFISSSPHLSRMFSENQMSVGIVDTDGRGNPAGNHFVLYMGPDVDHSTVYDPWPMQDRNGRQNQFTTNPSDVSSYTRALSQSGARTANGSSLGVWAYNPRVGN